MAVLKARKKAKRARKKSVSNLTYDVVCVGRAVQDTVLSGDVFKPVCSHGVCHENIPVGTKISVDNASIFYGGNALNASVTFARQKLSVALLAQIGQDSRSADILQILTEELVDSTLLVQQQDIKVGLSTIIVNTNGERSVLAYPGSEIKYQALLAQLEDVETRWIYLSSLNSLELLEGVARFAELNQIKVAFNPGGVELENIEQVKKIFKSIEVLILNKEEAERFFGPGSSADLARLGSHHSKICIVTDGPNGAHAFDGHLDYWQGISADVKVVDRNGAGDAFASGVVSGLAWGLELKPALELGSRNSTSVVSHVGAQTGILRLGE